jgi:hypothetical protein
VGVGVGVGPGELHEPPGVQSAGTFGGSQPAPAALVKVCVAVYVDPL